MSESTENPSNPSPESEAQVNAAENSTKDPAKELLEEWKNKAAYLAAEMDNMRKRFIRERGEVIKMANEDLLKAILPVFDNLLLGLKSVRDVEAKAEGTVKDHPILANLLKGVDMTLVHFEQTLDRTGVKAIEAVGKEFDPNIHEAVGESSDPAVANNIVTAEAQRGFSLHGRVIRPARVIVNKVSNA
jgi:molecular chaperone GrpE